MRTNTLFAVLIIVAITYSTIPSSGGTRGEDRFDTTSHMNKILYVGGNGPNNYTKIQDAIDDARDGDTVFVFNGTYFETLS